MGWDCHVLPFPFHPSCPFDGAGVDIKREEEEERKKKQGKTITSIPNEEYVNSWISHERNGSNALGHFFFFDRSPEHKSQWYMETSYHHCLHIASGVS
jgi:hypothetical protein